MNNPFEVIEARLNNIETLLLDLKHTPKEHGEYPTETDRFECGVQVACQELGMKPQSIYQNIENIPHRKLHGKLYFNRAELQEYIKNGGKTASQLKVTSKK